MAAVSSAATCRSAIDRVAWFNVRFGTQPTAIVLLSFGKRCAIATESSLVSMMTSIAPFGVARRASSPKNRVARCWA